MRVHTSMGHPTLQPTAIRVAPALTRHRRAMYPLRFRRQRQRHIYLSLSQFRHARGNNPSRRVHAAGQLSLPYMIASLYLLSPQNIIYTTYHIRVLHILGPLNPCYTNVYDTFMTFDDYGLGGSIVSYYFRHMISQHDSTTTLKNLIDCRPKLMGLSGRKVKQRIGNDPRNLSWADGPHALLSDWRKVTRFEQMQVALDSRILKNLAGMPPRDSVRLGRVARTRSKCRKSSTCSA